MPKSLLYLLGTGVTLMSFVFFFGLRATPKIDTSIGANFDFTAEYIFNFLTDIEKFPQRKKDLVNVEILDRNGQQITRWKENYNGGLWREYRVLKKIPFYSFEIELVGSSNFHRAVITFTLNEQENYTNVFLTEKGEIDHIFKRGLRFMLGDDSFLKNDLKWLRVAIMDELIKRP